MKRADHDINTLLADLAARNQALIEAERGERPKRAILFTKVPRTASTSLHYEFKSHLLDYLLIGAKRNVLAYYQSRYSPSLSVSHNHMPIAAILAGKVMSRPQYDERFKIGQCRNPWERTVSFYRLWESGKKSNGACGIAKGCNSFREFIEKLERTEKVTKFNPFSVKYSLTHPQWRWLLPELDAVIRYEHLHHDWAKVSKRLGLNFGIEAHVKQHDAGTTKPRKPYADYYDEELAKRVRAIYEVDCETFGYFDVEDRDPYEFTMITSNLKEVWKRQCRDNRMTI